MDTPDKTHVASTTSSSLSKFEDSPVFNYINNLSPLEQVKFGQAGRSFNSLTFPSPSSVFASPQVVSLRESRLKSLLSPDPLKTEISLFGSEIKVSKESVENARVSDPSVEQAGGLSLKCAYGKATDEVLDEALEKNDCGGSSSNWVCTQETETSRLPEGDGVQSSFSQSDSDNLLDRHHFKDEVNLRNISRVQQTDEAAGCNWVSLVSDAIDLNDSSPAIENNSEEQDQEGVDPGTITFVSTVLQLPQVNANDFENMVCSSPSASSKLIEFRETQSGETGDLQDKDQTNDILSCSLQNKLVVTDARAEVGEDAEKCGQSSCKLKIRRRCLVFETTGSHKTCSSHIPSQSDCEVSPEENHLVHSKTAVGHSLPRLPSVGLHLNSLATSSANGKFIKCKTLSSGKQLISMGSSISFDPLTSSGDVLIGPSTSKAAEKNSNPGDSDKVLENAVQSSVNTGGEEAVQNSPKRKRFKLELAGENLACKRCNCKRSKCLKLYCECFAAGLYCVEPCSCLDCFNKPTHEDTVLETRRQIESRNPLAFAPKVIRSTSTTADTGDETNKTPASARHKRGCNCRRSSCLKKYCECFQGGVGCSVSCRCEGCQNAYGRKEGYLEIEYKNEESEVCDNNELAYTIKKDEDDHQDASLPRPSIIARLSRGKRLGHSHLDVAPHPRSCTSLKHKTNNTSDQPNSQTQLQMTPEDETPKNLQSISLSTKVARPNSPNSKRLSPPRNIRESSSSSSLSISKRNSRKMILRSIHPFPSVDLLDEE